MTGLTIRTLNLKEEKMNPRMPRKFHFLGICFLLLIFVFMGCGEPEQPPKPEPKPELEKVEISPAESVVFVDEQVSFTASGISDKGEQMPDIRFNWSLNNDVGVIDDSGRFTAKIPGKVTITASAKDKSSQAVVTVNPLKISDIEVKTEKNRALAGQTIPVEITAVSASGKPAGYNVIDLSTSTEGTALSAEKIDLNPEGVAAFDITLSQTPQTNKIVLTSGDYTKEITIDGTKITRLEISPDSEKFEAGQTVNFSAVGYDDYGNGKDVEAEWSIVGKNVDLKDNGQVVMNTPGKNTILARYGEIDQGRPFMVVSGQLAKIELSPPKIEIIAGQTQKIAVKGFNQFGYPLPVDVEWSVENDVGEVSKDGTFLAKTSGRGAIKAAKGDVGEQVEVVVNHGPLADIRIEIEKETVVAGNTVNIKAVGVDAFGNTFELEPEWILSKAVGNIDKEKSTFTALNTGDAEIQAKVGNIIKVHQINVIPNELFRLRIDPNNVNIVAGDTIQFEVTGYDKYDNIVEISPNFSIREPLGELDQKGTFRAKKTGNTVIDARVKDISTQGTIAVTPAEMVKAVIEPEGPVTLSAGKALQFSAFGLDEYKNVVKTDLTWELSQDLGSIEKSGVLFPRKAGKANVIVTVRELKTDKTIKVFTPLTIEPGQPARVEIRPDAAQLIAGEKKQFTAIVYDAYDNPTKDETRWSVEESPIGDISDTGLFTAVKSGTGLIQVRVNNLTAASTVQVNAAEAAFLKITMESLVTRPGEKVKLDAVSEDKFGNVVEKDVIWNISNAELGKISDDNFFIPEKMGKGLLIAIANDIVDKIPLEVQKGALASIQVIPASYTVAAGSTFQFKAVGFDPGGNPVEIKPGWTIEGDLGTFSENGIFTAKKVGKGVITVSDNTVKTTATVEVIPGSPAIIESGVKEIQTTAGEIIPLDIKVYDAQKNMIPKPYLRFEIEEKIGVMTDDNGFLAQKAKEGKIRIIAGRASTEIPVEIKPGKLFGIEVIPKSIQIKSGSSHQFTANGYDQMGNSVVLEPKWSVSDGIGQIDEQGFFKAEITGVGYVSCQMGNVTGVSDVRVHPGPVHSIKVKPAQKTFVAGEVFSFKATAYDAFNTVTSADFTWGLESDTKLGEFKAPGKFMATTSGKGKIVVSSEDIAGSSDIRVEPSELSLLMISPEVVRIVSGETVQLKSVAKDDFENIVSIQPQWSVEPYDIGSIDGSGLFHARKTGSGWIKIESRGIETRVPVTVTHGKLQSIAIESPQKEYRAGKRYPFKAVGYDQGGNVVPAEIEWAVTPSIGTIDKKTGVFQAKTVGKGSVVAYVNDIADNVALSVNPGVLKYIYIEPNPVTVQSNTLQTFQAKGYDIENNLVEKLPNLDWEVQGGVGKFEAPGKFRGTKQGMGKITVSYNDLLSEAYVTVTPGEPDPGNSRIRLSHKSTPADGTSVCEVMVEVRDYYDNPVPEMEVRIISNRADNLKQPPKTDENGMAVGTISSNQPGISVISAVLGDMSFRDSSQLRFTEKP